MRPVRLSFLLAAVLLVVVVLAATSSARQLEPEPRDPAVPGEYRGPIKREGFPTTLRPSIRFVLGADGRVSGFEGMVTFSCGTKELKDSPAVTAHVLAQMPAVPSPGGIFKAREEADVSEVPETPTGSTHLSVRFSGWFDGAENRGWYRVITTDGTNCHGGGSWKLHRRAG